VNYDPNQPPPPAPPGPPPPGGAAGNQGSPGTAVGGFVCSLVGMILAIIGICFFIGGPLAVIGLVLSFVGRNHARDRGGSTGLATAGIVMGIIGILAALAWTAVAVTSDDSDVDFDFDTSVVLPATIALARLRTATLRRGGGER
jgi:hypothetical protein